jgi:pyocin large subunit-like protein
VTMAEYLRLAQSLRDRAAGGDVLEAVRGCGVVTRFDRASGAFLAFDPDGTIRTFFKPYDGERYFRRQLSRTHEVP